MVEINEAERQKRKRMKRNKNNFRYPWDNVKCPNIQTIRVTEKKRQKRKGIRKYLR